MTNEQLIQAVKEAVRNDTVLNKGVVELLCDALVAVTEQRDALAAESVSLTLAIPEPRNVEFNNDSMDDVSLAEDVGFNDAIGRMKINMTKTPATDSILGFLRAEGVEMFAKALRVPGDDPFMDAIAVGVAGTADNFARQLRENKGEVQS